MRTTLVKIKFLQYKIQIINIELLLVLILCLLFLPNLLADTPVNYAMYELLTPNILFAILGIITVIIISLFPIWSSDIKMTRVRRKIYWYESYMYWAILFILVTSLIAPLIVQIYLFLMNSKSIFEYGKFLLTSFIIFQTLLLVHLFITLLCNTFLKINYLLLGCLIYVLLWTASYGEKIFVFIQKFTCYWWITHNQLNAVIYQSMIIWGCIIGLYEIDKYLFKRREHYA